MFRSHCRFLRKSKEIAKNQILKAVGIDISAKDAKVDWDAFLTIGMMLNVKCPDLERQRWFAVKLFDPSCAGFTSSAEFEELVHNFFSSDDQDDDQ